MINSWTVRVIEIICKHKNCILVILITKIAAPLVFEYIVDNPCGVGNKWVDVTNHKLTSRGYICNFWRTGFCIDGHGSGISSFASFCCRSHSRGSKGTGITTDGGSLPPCFYRHSGHNFRSRKPFGSLVENFGLAGAVWQCSFSTIEYNYARRNKDNPIKMCLLPFIFALYVLTAKLVKSRLH